MSKNINKSKVYMIISVCILCISILGTSLAYYRNVLFNDNVNTITYGLDYYINYTKGQNITGIELTPVNDYLQGISSDIELWKKDNTYDIYGHIYLDIDEIGTNITKYSALKYALVNNDKIISIGTFKGKTTGENILIASNIPLQTSKQLYTVYVWLDINEDFDNSIQFEELSLTVRCEATMKIETSFIDYINNLYVLGGPTKITQDTSEQQYYYSYQDGTATWGLMNDGQKTGAYGTGSETIVDDITLINGTEGNIRYFGPSSAVDNYVYFNCSDYSNQSDATCEKWRIIGIVDGKVKIIRSEPIGNLAWDHDKNQDSSLITYNNNWSESSLQLLLNGLYYDRGTTTSHTYYSGNDGSDSVELDLRTIGINETTRDFVSKSYWYLGDFKSVNLYPNDIYNYERTYDVGVTVKEGNEFSIYENVGLMYASDYAYGTDLTKCNLGVGSYDESICLSNNWLFYNYYQWLITPRLSRESVWIVRWHGDIDVSYQTNNDGSSARPVLYLDTNVMLKKGDGTSESPYQIYIKEEKLKDKIKNLYTSGNLNLITQEESNDNYYYSYQDDTNSWGLMNDGLKVSDVYGEGSTTITNSSKLTSGMEGNIRYFGPSDSVKNYLYFNCSDYSNQSDSTCEKWRIIGIVDGKVKIIGPKLKSKFSWDYNSDGTYDNNWSDATLNILLNDTYYNSGTTTYYNNNTTGIKIGFENSGIKSSTRNLISDSIWYLGGYTSPMGLYPNDIYHLERLNFVGTTIFEDNPYSINAKIGLMYASDYGYGTDLARCIYDIGMYNDDTCRDNNWLYSGVPQWLITVDASSTIAWQVRSADFAGRVDNHFGVNSDYMNSYPVLYLEPNLTIKSVGDGTSDNPYRLDV